MPTVLRLDSGLLIAKPNAHILTTQFTKLPVDLFSVRLNCVEVHALITMLGDDNDDDAISTLEESRITTTERVEEEAQTQQNNSIESPCESFEENNRTPGNNDPSSSFSSATTSVQPELNLHTSDVLAKGVSSLLGTVMRDFDFKAENALKSQDQLCSAIDRLTRELDQLLEDAPLPFIMQNAAKISGVRKRVSSLNSLLKSIQRRVDNIDRMLSTGLPHEKPLAENHRQNQD